MQDRSATKNAHNTFDNSRNAYVRKPLRQDNKLQPKVRPVEAVPKKEKKKPL